MDVLWVNWRDKGLIQPGEGVVNEFVTFIFQRLNTRSGGRQVRVSGLHASDEASRGLGNELCLLQERDVEFLFLGKEPHITS